MKKTNKVGKIMLALTLVFVILLSDVYAVKWTKTQRVEAATDKCYSFSDEKNVKIGDYYYRINSNGSLQRSKSKKKNFKNIATSNAWDYLSNGKYIYYLNQSNNTQSTIYRCKMNGKGKKKILTAKKYLKLSILYNDKLYVAEGSESDGYVTYYTSLKGTAKLEKEQKELRLYNQRCGQYILGAEYEPTDVSPYGVCVYDTEEKKKLSLGAGLAARFIDKKVYYASFNEKSNCFSIQRCNPDGSEKEVLKTLDSTIWYVTKVTKTYCEGYSTSHGSTTVKIKY